MSARAVGTWGDTSENKQEKARCADTMPMADDLIVRSYSNSRPPTLAVPSSPCPHGARDPPTNLEDHPTFGSRIWHVGRTQLQHIGRREDRDSGNWSRHNSAGSGGFYDTLANDDDDDDHPVKMSTWAGQPKVEGRSETMRMVLLTCVSIGITSVHVPLPSHETMRLLTSSLQLHLGC